SGQLRYVSLTGDGNLDTIGINFNRTRKPFDDVLVRRAVNYAIDREQIVKSFVPHDQPRVQPWPHGLLGFEKSRENAYSYDPAKAKSLLKRAGYGDGLDAGLMLVAEQSAFAEAAQ